MTESEKQFAKRLTELGYKVYKNGWPDFFVTTEDGRAGCFIEYKQVPSTRMSLNRDVLLIPDQRAMFNALKRFGLPVTIVTNRDVNEDFLQWGIPLNKSGMVAPKFAEMVVQTFLKGVMEILDANAVAGVSPVKTTAAKR